MEKMKIGEVASRSGFSASAIRYYESVGVLPRPGRESGRRIYDQSVLTMLRWINLSQDAGFSVEEIKKLLHGFPASATPSQRWRELASAKIVELDESISRARKMKKLLREGLRCRCESLNQCIPAANLVRAKPDKTKMRAPKAAPRRRGMRGRW